MNIALIGYGNLARHLAPALTKAGLQINQWCIRDAQKHEEVRREYSLNPVTAPMELDESSELIFLLVNDDAIHDVSSKLGDHPAIICHCSGMTRIDAIVQERRAVFYPLNTFSGNQYEWDETTPILIQSREKTIRFTLKDLAKKLSKNVSFIEESERGILHLSAVLSQNFSNYLIARAEELLIRNKIDRKLIHPLLHTMMRNIDKRPAHEVQTGPAVRKDQVTMEAHEELLDGALLEVYQLLSSLIDRAQSKD